MKRFSRKTVVIFDAIVVTLSLILCLMNSDLLFMVPAKNICLSDAADVFFNGRETYILNDSGTQLLRIDENNRVSMMLVGGGVANAKFDTGEDVICDSAGNIYIHQLEMDKEAYSWISRESILKFDSKGALVDTMCEYNYKEPRLNSVIVKLQLVNGVPTYTKFTNYGIAIYSLKGQLINEFEFSNSEFYIADTYYDDEAEALYVVTKDGKIIYIDSDNYQKILLEASPSNNVFPYSIALDEEGNIYTNDLQTKSIGIVEDGVINEVLAMDDGYIPYELTYNDKIIYNAVDEIGIGEELYIEYQLSDNLFFMSVVVFVAELLLCFAVLNLIIFAYVYIIKNGAPSTKAIILFITFTVIITALFCMLIYDKLRDTTIDEMLDREYMTASLVDRMMPKNAYQRLDGVWDFGSPDYMAVKKVVDSVVLENGVTPGDMYLSVYDLNDDNEVIVKFLLENSYGCNFPYIWSDGVDEQHTLTYDDLTEFSDVSDSDGTYLLIYAPLHDDDGNPIAVLDVGIMLTAFNQKIIDSLFDIAQNVFAAAIVIILLFIEVMAFVNGSKKYNESLKLDKNARIPVEMFRVIVFIVFFATNITTPFLSIYALQLAREMNLPGFISAEVAAACPIAAEVLFGAIFSIAGVRIVAKFGNRLSGIISAIAFTGGLALRFAAPSLVLLTIGNAIQGSGWGILLLIVEKEIASRPDEDERERGFSEYNIALQNGMNSGIVFGGFMLLFMGYKHVLIMASVLSTIALIFVLRFIKGHRVENKADRTKGEMSFARFITRPKIVIYFLCIVVPVIAASYYLNFLYPIIADELGMADNVIGYSYLFNGMVIILFGNAIVSFMTKRYSKRMLLLAASVIYLVSFAIVGIFNSIPVLIVVLVLLAVSDSFGYVVQETYYMELEEVEEYGTDRAIGVYSLVENLSQALGSFVFGYILAVGLKAGLILYGIIIAAMAVIFFISVGVSNRKKNRLQNGESCEVKREDH